MTESITALYENGVLRPLTPLKLRERQTVRIQILDAEPTLERNEAAIRNLVVEGVLTLPPGRSDLTPPSDSERLALADRLGYAPGKPLSEIVLEERGEL
ncbi:MAG: antitoxin family protein [Anaerolineae bacterium]|nr:antitoxin family protein [Anaerolineae bacterium]